MLQENLPQPFQNIRVHCEEAGTGQISNDVIQGHARVSKAVGVSAVADRIQLIEKRLHGPGIVRMLNVPRGNRTAAARIGRSAVTIHVGLERCRSGWTQGFG